MREIKFRKWSKNTKGEYRMKYVFDYDEMSKNPKYWDAIYMQYTGLKDKNGKEIYEFDILESGRVVKYEQGGDYYTSWIGFEIPEIDDEVEVIGNIYENPELLTKKKGK